MDTILRVRNSPCITPCALEYTRLPTNKYADVNTNWHTNLHADSHSDF